jgi:D-3-phosphoglycerate dehydrogenase / 2-oxoglutarate reductase
MTRRPRILLAEPEFSEAARRILSACGEVVDYGSDEEFRRHLPDAEALVVGLDVAVRTSLLEQAPRLRVIASRTSQLLHVDVDEARRRGIEILSNEPAAPALRQTSSTAELAIALVLALARNLPWAFESLKQGRWERRRFGGSELQGKTLGLVGFGRLGRRVATYAAALGMDVVVSDPRLTGAEARRLGVESAPLEELLRRADVVSLHASYTPGSPPLLGERQLRALRPSALLVNTARGELVDEEALLDALAHGRLAAAAVDTLRGEEPDGSHLAGNPLVRYAATHDNLLIVPHLGGATAEATERTQIYISERLVEYLRSRRSAPSGPT